MSVMNHRLNTLRSYLHIDTLSTCALSTLAKQVLLVVAFVPVSVSDGHSHWTPMAQSPLFPQTKFAFEKIYVVYMHSSHPPQPIACCKA